VGGEEPPVRGEVEGDVEERGVGGSGASAHSVGDWGRAGTAAVSAAAERSRRWCGRSRCRRRGAERRSMEGVPPSGGRRSAGRAGAAPAWLGLQERTGRAKRASRRGGREGAWISLHSRKAGKMGRCTPSISPLFKILETYAGGLQYCLGSDTSGRQSYTE